MPNLSQILKAEISRIARREINISVKPLRSSHLVLKKSVAQLKRETAFLESENKRLSAFFKTAQVKSVKPEDIKNARITARNVRALRKKLGLPQWAFGRLIGVTGHAVFLMERKGGRLRLRQSTLTNFLSIRGIGKREAKRRLEEVSNKAE